MARFYARFDGATESALENTTATGGFFSKLRIGANNTEGTSLRNGLLDSRSLLSTDVYADLDGVNKNGANGTYFPPDSPGLTINTVTPPTFVSWSNGFSSTLEGIKTPTTNVYGVADSLNYSKRPTESVSYTSSTWVTAFSPADSIGASYETYYSASAAVRTVVNAIQTTPGAVTTTPYTRPGDNPSRTIHSLWNNPGTDYFAWDDFTPGLWDQTQVIHTFPVATGCPPTASLGDPVSIDAEFVVVVFAAGEEFPNDKNIGAKIGFTMTLTESGSGGNIVARLQLGGAQDVSTCANCGGTPLLIGDYRTGTGPTGNRGSSNSTWSWNAAGPSINYELRWTVPLTAGEYNLRTDSTLHDAVITTHTKSANRQNFAGQDCSNHGTFMVAAGQGI